MQMSYSAHKLVCRRDREERDAQKEAEAERERLRTMTPEERAAWERANPKVDPARAPKKSWKFMQKYWHKGAFFQDTSDNVHSSGQQPDAIFTRDFSAAVGEDKLNKEILPKVCLCCFGRQEFSYISLLACIHNIAILQPSYQLFCAIFPTLF